MADFVLEASIAISWCFPGDPTEDTPYSRSVLKELIARDAIVPEIWGFEIANNANRMCRPACTMPGESLRRLETDMDPMCPDVTDYLVGNLK